MSARMHFIGVTTGQSSIMKLFPRWAEVLGIDAEVVGRDLPIGAPADAYTRMVEEIRADEGIFGALITTHKVAVYQHARNLLSHLDRWAGLCEEISCISRKEGDLLGHAKDPITSGMSMDQMLGRTYWADHPNAEVLCMGAGGSGTAISARLLSEDQRPGRIVITNRSPGPLERLRRIHEKLGAEVGIEYRPVAGPGDSDALLHSLAPESLVINATGMGKDRPGSPITDQASFPDRGVVWDLNYRGDLVFLRQAHRQGRGQRLTIHDGWRYFLYGWAEHISEVFHLKMTEEMLAQLDEAARELRPA